MFLSWFVGLFVCLLVSNFAQKLRTDSHEIFREGWQWTNKQTAKFWWRSGLRIRIRIRIRIATLIKRALAEVCTVPVLLVSCYGITGYSIKWPVVRLRKKIKAKYQSIDV